MVDGDRGGIEVCSALMLAELPNGEEGVGLEAWEDVGCSGCRR